jgi:hypothetical protein
LQIAKGKVQIEKNAPVRISNSGTDVARQFEICNLQFAFFNLFGSVHFRSVHRANRFISKQNRSLLNDIDRAPSWGAAKVRRRTWQETAEKSLQSLPAIPGQVILESYIPPGLARPIPHVIAARDSPPKNPRSFKEFLPCVPAPIVAIF